MMRRASFLGLAGLAASALAASACGHGTAAAPGAAGAPAAPAKQAGGSPEVVVDFDSIGSEKARAAWLLYGMAKVAHVQDHPPPPANESADDFEPELEGRKALVEVWSEQHGRDADLDRQLKISRAGYLREYVVAVLAHPGWTIPGPTVAALRLEEFVGKFPGDYRAGAPVAVKAASGKLVPDVPGDDFPDPQRLPVSPASCNVAVAERQAAWARWERLAPRLGGVPVSASSPLHFARQLVIVKHDADGPPPAVTWVSERVAHLAMVDGFCAVEARNFPLAAKILTRAVSLNPASPDPRLELSGALTSIGQLGDALRQADMALARAQDGCSVARAWRKRGYILIEMEAFEAARIAYEKSLAVDPGNPIALSELETIAKAQKQPGNWRAKPAPGKPPPDPIVVTTCRAGKPVEK